MKRNIKKVITLMLAFVFAISAFAVAPNYAIADADTRVIYVDWDKADCLSKIGTTAPTYDGYLFAGWVNKSTGQVVSEASEIGDSDVQAKFVRADMSRISCQLNWITDENVDPDTRNMRFVSIVDSKQYYAVGFNVYLRLSSGTDYLMYGHGTERTTESTKVYSGLKKYSSSTEYTTLTPADVFGSEANGYRFTTAQISGVKKKYFDLPLITRPYWITKDGTYVEGLGEFNRIHDKRDGIVNISANIKQATNIAAGMLTVDYDSDKFTYVGADYGRVFKQMRFFHAGSAVKCAGVVATASNTSNPNDVFVNLRFTKKVSVSPGASTFTVSGASFCDIDETFKTVNAPSVKY